MNPTLTYLKPNYSTVFHFRKGDFEKFVGSITLLLENECKWDECCLYYKLSMTFSKNVQFVIKSTGQSIKGHGFLWN